MNPGSSHQLQHKLEHLHLQYVRTLPIKLGEFESLWETIQQDTSNQAALSDLRRKAHSLAGSGSTFGFETISKLAQDLERCLNESLEKNNALDDESVATIAARISRLSKAIANPEKKYSPAAYSPVVYEPARPPLHNENRLIFLVEDEQDFADELGLQLNLYGFNVKSFASLAGLRENLAREEPGAIIMDIIFPEGNLAGTEHIIDLREALLGLPPVIFISQRNDIEARLEAVRAGGIAYYSKPVDIISLTDLLDRLIIHHDSIPYRIMLIDDDESQAYYNALMIERAGMTTEVLIRTDNLIKALTDFQPELIVMDLYLSDCTGIELARVIRQQPSFIGTPIVFYSIETNIATHLEAIRAGGDEFLLKPLDAHYLVASIESRVRRARELNSLMIRDSLTGLLNHSTMEDHLEREISVAKRMNTIVSLALIDLDHFKVINDTYGHGVGDRVLIGFARMIRQRLRKSDLIARYGGEEFAVIMPNTTVTTAHRLLTDIRIAFHSIIHSAKNQEFKVSISVGIAGLPPHLSAFALQEAADKALYKAKHMGRNTVITDESLYNI